MWSDKPLNGASLPRRNLVLTFDDGPGPATVDLGEFLAEEGIQAVFFVVGKHLRLFPASITRLLELGHVVGNHTENHLCLTDTSVTDEEARAEVFRTSAALAELGVPAPQCFRPPYGAWNAHLAHVFKGGCPDGIGPINWDIYGGDYRCWRDRRSPETCTQSYIDAAGQHHRGIVLFHDSSADDPIAAARNRTFEMVRLLIPRLRELGYTFRKLVEIPELSRSGKVGFL